MTYNLLTESEKALARWLVHQVRSGNLPEEFHVVWVFGGGRISVGLKPWNQEDHPTITKGMLDALAEVEILYCMPNYRTTTTTTGSRTRSRVISQEREINRRCRLTGKAYNAVDSDFAVQDVADASGAIVMSGDFRYSILNIQSRLTNLSQSIGELVGVKSTEKAELKQLIEQLKGALETAPEDKVEEAEAVAWAAESLIDLVDAGVGEKPNRLKIQITKEGLKKAAENIADVLPKVLSIALKIAAVIDRLPPVG